MNEKAFMPSGLNVTPSLDGLLLVRLTGDWKIGNPLPLADEVGKKLTAGTQIKRVGFDTSELKTWDSGLLTFLIKVKELCSQNKIPLEAEGLPEGAKGLLKLASAVAERKGARKEVKKESFFSMVGTSAVEFYRSAIEMVSFIGEATITFSKFLVGRATSALYQNDRSLPMARGSPH